MNDSSDFQKVLSYDWSKGSWKSTWGDVSMNRLPGFRICICIESESVVSQLLEEEPMHTMTIPQNLDQPFQSTYPNVFDGVEVGRYRPRLCPYSNSTCTSSSIFLDIIIWLLLPLSLPMTSSVRFHDSHPCVRSDGVESEFKSRSGVKHVTNLVTSRHCRTYTGLDAVFLMAVHVFYCLSSYELELILETGSLEYSSPVSYFL